MRMVLTGLAVGFAIGLTPVGAQAQNGTPDSEGGRYSFHRVDDGYLRLDVRSGQVSLCSRRTVGWACHPIPDERAALESEIARLQGANATLKKDLLARGLPLPDTIKPEPPTAKLPEVELKLPSNADIDRMMSVVERMWRRLVEMIENLQKDMLRKT